jgi:hypothetical protein
LLLKIIHNSRLIIICLLAHLGCSSKIPYNGQFINSRNFLPTILETGKSKIKVLADWVLYLNQWSSYLVPSMGSICLRPLLQGHWCHSWGQSPHDLMTSHRPHALIPSPCRLGVDMGILGHSHADHCTTYSYYRI